MGIIAIKRGTVGGEGDSETFVNVIVRKSKSMGVGDTGSSKYRKNGVVKHRPPKSGRKLDSSPRGLSNSPGGIHRYKTRNPPLNMVETFQAKDSYSMNEPTFGIYKNINSTQPAVY